MAVLQIVAKAEKVDKTGATYWDLETNTGKHRAWERNNKEGFQIGNWYECEITQQGNFLPQIQHSVLIDAPPSRQDGTGGVQDMITSSVPAVPQEVWDAKDRAVTMESAIRSAVMYVGALATTGESRTATDLLAIADMFYNHIQEARNGTMLLRANSVIITEKTAGDVQLPPPRPASPQPPLVLELQTLRKEVFGEDMEAFKEWAGDQGFIGKSGKGVDMQKLDQVVAALREQIKESEELPI